MMKSMKNCMNNVYWVRKQQGKSGQIWIKIREKLQIRGINRCKNDFFLSFSKKILQNVW